MPPSPRMASESRNWGAFSRKRAVGWNWTNSMSTSAAPARQAMAMPSPVATAGLVVRSNSWPAPPVASRTARAEMIRTFFSACWHTMAPTHRPFSMIRSRVKAKSIFDTRPCVADLVDQDAHDLPARGVSLGMEDPALRVGRLLREGEFGALAGRIRRPRE